MPFLMDQMSKEIRIFKRKLTNLSSANPLLWMTRLKSDIHFDLSLIEDLDGKSGRSILETVLSDQKSISLGPIHDPRNADENKLSEKLNRLRKSRKLVMQERGVDDLFLAWPFVLGQWQDGSWVRTPFLFIPVDLVQDKSSWKLRPEIKRAMINPAFLLAYAFHTGKTLDNELFEKEIDLDAKDGAEFLTALYELLKQSNIEINFNSDLFSNHLNDFQTIRKSELPPGFQPGVLKLQPQAVLGLFAQSDSLLVPDFEFLENNKVSLESIFLKEPSGKNEQVGNKHLFFPFAVDGSQEECIRAVREGKSLVVQGPPGTGKSQLISNLIADSMAAGKTILLVCQKKVALEVVHRRLSEIGIETHVGLWADFKKDLTKINQQLASHIDALEETESRNNGLDTVLLERNFTYNSQQTDKICSQFDHWRNALFNENTAGISWVDLNRIPVPEEDERIPFASDLQHFKFEKWNTFIYWFERHFEIIRKSREPGTILEGRSLWLGPDVEPFDEIGARLKSISTLLSDMKASMKSRGFNWEDQSIVRKLQGIVEKAQYQNATQTKEFDNVLAKLSSVPLRDLFKTGVLEILEEEAEILLAQHSTLAFWPGGIAAELNEIYLIQELETRFSGSGNSDFVLGLISLVNSKANQMRKFRRLAKVSGLTNVLYLELVAKARMYLETSAASVVFQAIPFQGSERTSSEILLKSFLQHLPLLREMRVFYHSYSELFPGSSIDGFQSLHKELKWVMNWQEPWNRSLHYLGKLFPAKKKVLQIIADPKVLDGLLSKNETLIRQTDLFLLDAEIESRELILKILKEEELKNIEASRLKSILQKSWIEFWKAKILSDFPVLEYPPEWFQKDISELGIHLEANETLSKNLVKLRIEENTHKDILRNRLQNRVSYRGLYHQVTKKRMRLPMRLLWQLYQEEIVKLIPCWLATPESVSATWPMENCFDIVVFDEASQCFAEKAIPAAFRGSQLVVIGDDKQLPPNQLFSSRWEEEQDAEDYYSEHDSFLDLAKQFLPQKMLKVHYRSQFPELIHFSNQNFYRGRLEVFPSPDTLLARQSQLFFYKVEGVWENQQNKIEAEFIAGKVVSFFQTETSESLGIITFNARQQALVEEKVEGLAIQEGVIVPTSFFVKNIENVQGDERDHIWFSIAYARNAKGQVVNQFGSLSQEGGENRLNVAISRARKSVTVVSSLHPGEFSLSDSAYTGPKLLKQYLEFVFLNQNDLLKEFVKGSSDQQQLFQGSISYLCDSIEIKNETDVHLVFKKPESLLKSGSTKEFFGLRPLFLRRLGYSVHFDFPG